MPINLTLLDYKTVPQLADAFLKGEGKKRDKANAEDVFADGRNCEDSTVNLFLKAALVLLENRDSWDYDDLIPLLKVMGFEDFTQIKSLYDRWTEFLILEGKVKKQAILINNFPLFIKCF